MTALESSPLRGALRAWYRPRREGYPWRRQGVDPYAVLVSEVMLQQTQAARVASAFEGFLRRFPDVSSLAAASRADVIRAWAGLGYHRRAVALHEAARTIVRVHGGMVPRDPRALQQLPGIGRYTASAVAAIAFLALAFAMRMRTLIRGHLSRSLGYPQLGAGLAMLAMAAHGLFDFNFHIPANALYFSFLAGVFFFTPAEDRA